MLGSLLIASPQALSAPSSTAITNTLTGCNEDVLNVLLGPATAASIFKKRCIDVCSADLELKFSSIPCQNPLVLENYPPNSYISAMANPKEAPAKRLDDGERHQTGTATIMRGADTAVRRIRR